jgi:hypothetical protein
MPTFEEYLVKAYDEGKIDHSLRVDVDDKGNVSFYIYPTNTDKEALEFYAVGDMLFVK